MIVQTCFPFSASRNYGAWIILVILITLMAVILIITFRTSAANIQSKAVGSDKSQAEKSTAVT
jgi:uncharacterized membrane protein